MPVLDFAGAGPEGEVEGFGGLEEFAESAYVNGVHFNGNWGLGNGDCSLVIGDG